MEIPRFKSASPFFERERDGRKPNTTRIVDVMDPRFKLLKKMERENCFGQITIVHAVTCDWFTRQITDISFWENLCIISWAHPINHQEIFEE